MSKKWYIVNVQTGCESTAKASIEERIKLNKMQESFGDILIPTENVVELVKGQKKTRPKKFYPGYIFVNMDMSDKTWHLVKGSSKVSGFIGGVKPMEVPEKDVVKVNQQIEGVGEKPKPKFNFNIGEGVVIVDGPFNSFNGTVEEINEEKGKLKVLVSIFGRPTPVELDFVQVEKT